MSSYNRRTKIFFSVMAFLLVVGYPLSLLGGFSGFTNLFTSNGNTDPKSLIDSARSDINKHPHDKSRMKDDLRKMGVSYLELAAPNASGVAPDDASQDYSNAIDAFSQWVKLAPSDTDAQSSLAQAYTGNSDYAKAEQIYAKLAQNKSAVNYSDYIFAWGSAAAQANDTATAIKAFQQYLKVDPTGQDASEAQSEIPALQKQLKTGSSSTAGSSPISVGG